MQVYTKQLFNYSLSALDGEIGRVIDIYFHDNSWTVRYLVVETGNWLFKRKVLISPLAIEHSTTLDHNALKVKLSKEQVKSSPDIDTEQPISIQQESSLFDHYAWPLFGGSGVGWPTENILKSTTAKNNNMLVSGEFDSNLRSFLHVSKYEVHNDIGRVGLVKDLVIDLENWSILFLLIDDVFTSDQERVIIPTDKILSINWDTYQVKISLSQNEIQTASRINADGFFSSDSIKLFPPK